MVFVYVPHRRRPIGATQDEMEKLRELRAHGLEGEGLERALVTSGIEPGRARLLVEGAGPPSPEGVARGIGAALAVVALGLAFALAERPLRDWLHRNWPGTEWLVGLAFPLLVMLVLFWRLQQRRRSAADAPDGATRTDQIDNRPIG